MIAGTCYVCHGCGKPVDRGVEYCDRCIDDMAQLEYLKEYRHRKEERRSKRAAFFNKLFHRKRKTA